MNSNFVNHKYLKPWLIWAAIWIMVLFILTLAALPLFAYFKTVGLPSSTDRSGWAQVGSYIGGMLGPVLTMSNIGITLITFFTLNHYRYRQSTAFDLHKEWMSESMYEQRNAADLFTSKHPGGDLRKLYKKREPGMEPVWVVMGFFQRLQLSAEYHRVPDNLLTTFFGQLFIWWYVVCFQHNLPEEWDGSAKIHALHTRITRATDEKTLRGWNAIAEEDLREKERQLTRTSRKFSVQLRGSNWCVCSSSNKLIGKFCSLDHAQTFACAIAQDARPSEVCVEDETGATTTMHHYR